MPKFNSIYVVKKLDTEENEVVEEILKEIKMLCKHQFVKFIDDKENIENDTLIISLGGDGTMLYAMKLSVLYGGTVLGVNLGNLGFLADFSKEGFDWFFRQIISDIGDKKELDSKYYFLEERLAYQVKVDKTDKKDLFDFLIMNDVVIGGYRADSVITYDLSFVKNRSGYVQKAGTHVANGLIISTPTGSTAYALNAGGAIIEPTADCVQVLPIAAATLTSRPLILNPQTIKICVTDIKNKDRIVVRIDGQDPSIKHAVFGDFFTVPVEIEIEPLLNQKAKVIHKRLWNHFDNLSRKLHWNKRFI